ncbi:MAG: phosphopyruvate hydratase [Patescibacteria group bacterium]
MSVKIRSVVAREILASDGSPTVECRATLDNGIIGTASVPYGVSAGAHEACMLLDGNRNRYNGKGMQKACANVNSQIAKKLAGQPVENFSKIDQLMITLDGTPNKKRLGGNAILSVSLAVARAAAASKKLPLYTWIRKTFGLKYPSWSLPKPMMVVIEGGKHADDSTDMQEFLFSVHGAPSIAEAVRWGEESYQSLKRVLKTQGLNTNVGNEGAYAPSGLSSNESPLALMVEAITKAGFRPGRDISISLDPAASEFYDKHSHTYILKREGKGLTSAQMVGLYQEWIRKYPILTLEDGLAEDDWDGWAHLYKAIGGSVRVIGDDLTVTNVLRVKKAIQKKAINAVLIKLNQIGTLSETIDTVRLGQQHGFWQVVSHRGGGETNDPFLVDVAVAVNAEYIKVGPARGERVAKYNRLMAIEQELSARPHA